MTCCRKLEAHFVCEQFNMRAGMLAFRKTTMILQNKNKTKKVLKGKNGRKRKKISGLETFVVMELCKVNT